MEINKKTTEINQKVIKLKEDKNRIKNQLNTLNASSSYIRKEVIVLLETDVATTTNVKLNYLVYNAGWSRNNFV